MGWVQLVFFQADGVEILKDISEKECVCEEVEVMIVLECLTLKSLQGCLANQIILRLKYPDEK